MKDELAELEEAVRGDFEIWADEYEPVENSTTGRLLFQAESEEFIKLQDPRCLWSVYQTYLSDDSSNFLLGPSGYLGFPEDGAFVGYVLTSNQCPDPSEWEEDLLVGCGLVCGDCAEEPDDDCYYCGGESEEYFIVV
jgi:hypothetical protein